MWGEGLRGREGGREGGRGGNSYCSPYLYTETHKALAVVHHTVCILVTAPVATPTSPGR